ncbi:hypothetical protein CDAR_73741 [Caerostris darwini]|uniref:Uncharacterized protein n=1 Tax=Caerostris darwini TaxID=1538125 RepID=A0AAV4MTP3_9ARAC|nr:hypothetical protein CDAR_73741 [Caerostris darwini]
MGEPKSSRHILSFEYGKHYSPPRALSRRNKPPATEVQTASVISPDNEYFGGAPCSFLHPVRHHSPTPVLGLWISLRLCLWL